MIMRSSWYQDSMASTLIFCCDLPFADWLVIVPAKVAQLQQGLQQLGATVAVSFERDGQVPDLRGVSGAVDTVPNGSA